MGAAETDLQRDVHALYSDHHGWLFAWLRRKLGCADNAADVAQDTFVRIIVSRDALLGMREPRPYLATTARRLLIDRARRQKLEQAYLAELARTAEHVDGYPSPEQIHVTVEALDQIGTALGDLPDKVRQAFLMHYLDGDTHRTVAARLGVTDRMVRKYLTRALLHCQRRAGIWP